MMWRWVQLGTLALATLTCESHSKSKPQAQEAEVKTKAPASASAQPEKPKPPWFARHWEGDYQVAKRSVELLDRTGAPGRSQGQQVGWVADRGKTAVGSGRLSLSIDPQGVAQGEAHGALGDQKIRGEVQEGHLLLRLEPLVRGLDSFGGSGQCTLEKAQQQLNCSLAASSGDANLVRAGQSTLKPKAEKQTEKEP